MKDALSKVPIFKILTPFLLGIIVASYTNIPNTCAIIAITFSIMALFVFRKIKSPYISLKYNYINGIFIVILCSGLGILNVNISRNDTFYPKYDNAIAHAKILDISNNDFSTSLQLQLTHISIDSTRCIKANEKLLAWIEGNDYTLTEGDIISFIFTPEPITSRGNPEDFDFARYTKYKGFNQQVFIRDQKYIISGHDDDIFTHAKHIQRFFIELLLDSKLNPEVKTFFITILLGDSSLLNQDIRDAFSLAGIAHILALSGLHIGIIALLFSILFFPLDYINQKKLRLILTLITIIIYAFVTGLSVSVIRATIMIGFVIVAKILHRKNTPINALFSSALIILIINPFGIFDIGFQLSFTTVLFILLLTNKIDFFSPKKKMLKYVSSLVVVSIISLIATTWLTIFYFNQTSLMSIVANIIILPVLPIIVGLGLIYLFLLSVDINLTIITNTLNSSYQFINDIAIATENTPFSHFDYIYISKIPVILIYIAMLLIVAFIYYRKTYFIYYAATILIGSILYISIERNNTPTKGYVIYNDNKNTPVLTFNNHKATILAPNDSINLDKFKRSHKQFFSKYQIHEIEYDTCFYHKNDVIYKTIEGKTFSIICNNTLKYNTLSPKINIDYIIITKCFYGGIKDILNSFNPNTIILSGDIYFKKHDILLEECKSLNITCHSIKNDGSVYQFFND